MSRLLFIPLLLLFLSVANAENSEHLAHEAYREALTKISSARQLLSAEQSLSFVQTVESHSGELNSQKITLSLDENGEEVFKRNNNQTRSNEQLNWQTAVLVNPNRFPNKAEFLKETNLAWIFTTPSFVKANMEGGSQSFNGDNINNRLASALTSELTVSKVSPRFLSLKIHAPKPFKPETMVRVNEFNVRVEYGEAWPDGPLVAKTTTRLVKGKYAYFITVDEFSIITHNQFELVK